MGLFSWLGRRNGILNDRRGFERREFQALKDDILQRYAAMEPDTEPGTVSRIRAVIEDGARRLGIELPTPDDSDTKRISA